MVAGLELELTYGNFGRARSVVSHDRTVSETLRRLAC
jgi:hypothetical protein